MKLCGNLKFYQSNVYSTLVPSDGKLSYHFFDFPRLIFHLSKLSEKCEF